MDACIGAELPEAWQAPAVQLLFHGVAEAFGSGWQVAQAGCSVEITSCLWQSEQVTA